MVSEVHMEEPVTRSRAGYEAFDAIDPGEGTLFEVFVSHRRMGAVARRGIHAVMELAYVVSEVLRTPRRIYEGLRWEGDLDAPREPDEWLCYVGRPSADFRTPDSQDASPPRPDRLFLVFVNEERVAYNWRWEQAAENSEDEPMGMNATNPRFRRRVL